MKEISFSLHRLLTRSQKTLCRPLEETGEEDLTYCKNFEDFYSISLRPMNIQTELPLIEKWFNGEFGINASHTDELHLIYSDTGKSDFAQSFMALRNDIPVCLVDICQAEWDDTSYFYPAAEGDFIICLLADPQEKNTLLLYSHLLQTATEYFFNYPEVNRLVITFIKKQHMEVNSAIGAGFRLLENYNQHPDCSLVLYYDRNMYNPGQHKK